MSVGGPPLGHRSDPNVKGTEVNNAVRDRLIRFTWWPGAIIVILALAGCHSESVPEAPESAPSVLSQTEEPVETALSERTRDERLAESDRMLEDGDFAGAESKLKSLLLEDPEDAETAFRLATIQAQRGDLASAIDLLDSIPVDHPEAGLPALGQSADWCLEIERYDEAERRYKLILEKVPGFAIAHRKLAQLFNRQGRRHEAAVHVYALCAQGNVRQDELHSLIVLSDAMASEPDKSDPDAIDYSPIGASGKARLLFTEHRYAEAAETLAPAADARELPASMIAFYGRILAEAQQDDAFLRWLGGIDNSVRGFSEYWSALATYLAGQREYEGGDPSRDGSVGARPNRFSFHQPTAPHAQTDGTRERKCSLGAALDDVQASAQCQQ